MTIIEDLSKNSFMDLLHYLNSTRMQYRKSLNLPSSVTFGNEIEVNDIILDDAREIVEDFNMRKKLWGRDHFIVHKDLTCDSEIVTPIMTDKPKYWSLLWDMYMCLDEHGATYSDNTSSHIHMGTSLFDTPEKLSLLLKTLVVFEPIIFKFDLTAGHAVDRVVDEDRRDLLAAVRRVHDLRRADRREVAVALIGEDVLIRMHALEARRNRRRSAVRRFVHIDVHVVVKEDRAADGCDARALLLNAQLLDDLSHHAMHDSVTAARAVMERNVR